MITSVKKAVSLVGVLLGLTICASACSPAPTAGGGPCSNHYFAAELAVTDALGNVAARMTMHETLCATNTGYVISNTATQDAHNVGFYGFTDGGNLQEHSVEDGYGPTGAWMPDRIITVHWNLDLLYGLLGHGWTVGIGNCTLSIDVTSFLSDFQEKWYQGWCSEVSSRMGG